MTTTMTTTMTPLDKVRDLAQPFTSRQAGAGGLTRSELRLLLAESQVRHVLHDVYVVNDVPDTIEVGRRPWPW